MDLLQNRRFVRGSRRFLWHVTKCHACHRICTLSPLRAALTMRFAENMQHDTSKVLRLPRKMKAEVSKVLRLPRKMQHIFWKWSKSIASETQNDFWRVLKHDGMPRSATPATQNDMTTSSDTSNKSCFCDFSHRHGNFEPTMAADGRLQTVADGCGRQKQGHANTGQPPDPQNVKREPFAMHSGKKCYVGRSWLIDNVFCYFPARDYQKIQHETLVITVHGKKLSRQIVSGYMVRPQISWDHSIMWLFVGRPWLIWWFIVGMYLFFVGHVMSCG